ncbi:mevalonate kinase [bacterium AH-315-E10]|nr:mevalonate kinase [bacterium AH-315-E10]
MTESIIRAKAPGKLMMLGEHAVLHGYRSMVCAVDQYITVELKSRNDRVVHITSSIGDLVVDLENIVIDEPFQFICSCLKSHADSIQNGFDLTVNSDFPHNVGLGSSAAVTVATHAALYCLTGATATDDTIFEKSIETVRAIQGTASGADVAASVYGGIIVYRMNPMELKQFTQTCPITVVYSGAKEKTSHVIRFIQEKYDAAPDEYDGYFRTIDNCVESAIDALNANDWGRVGDSMKMNHLLMKKMELTNPAIDNIITELNRSDDILAAKISGSGKGDCVIALGKLAECLNYEVYDMAISPVGVEIEIV